MICREVADNTWAWRQDGVQAVFTSRQNTRRLKKAGRPITLNDEVFAAVYGEPLPPDLVMEEVWDVLTEDQIPSRPKPKSLRLDENTRVGLYPPSDLGAADSTRMLSTCPGSPPTIAEEQSPIGRSQRKKDTQTTR